MKTTLIVLALLVIAFAVMFVVLRTRKPGAAVGLPVFSSKKPLTPVEQMLYHRLIEALPECVVLAQVQISQLVIIEKGMLWQTWFNKISRKSADYVICLKDFTVVCVIELDDSTHERKDRKKADTDKDTALTGAGYKIIRWQAKNLPDIETIRKTFHD